MSYRNLTHPHLIRKPRHPQIITLFLNQIHTSPLAHFPLTQLKLLPRPHLHPSLLNLLITWPHHHSVPLKLLTRPHPHPSILKLPITWPHHHLAPLKFLTRPHLYPSILTLPITWPYHHPILIPHLPGNVFLGLSWNMHQKKR